MLPPMPPLKPVERMKISASSPKRRKASARRRSSGGRTWCSTARSGPSVLMLLHDAEERRLVEPFDRRQPLGDELAVTAVAAENVVLGAERQGSADGRAFLPDREVRRPAIGVLDPAIGAARLEFTEHRFEFAHDQHVAQHVDQEPIAAPRAFVGQRPGVGMHRNRGESDLPAFPHDLSDRCPALSAFLSSFIRAIVLMRPSMSKSSLPAAAPRRGPVSALAGSRPSIGAPTLVSLHRTKSLAGRCGAPCRRPIPRQDGLLHHHAAICTARGGEGTSLSQGAVYPFVGLHDQMFELWRMARGGMACMRLTGCCWPGRS